VKPSLLNLKPSFYLAYLLGLVSLIACGIVSILSLPLWMRAIAILLIALVSSFYIARDALLILPAAWCAVYLNQKQQIMVQSVDGKKHPARVLPSTIVFPFVTILNFKVPNCFWVQTMIILPDRVDVDIFRRWRVFLIWQLAEQMRKNNS
jgi:toxin CptA